MDYLLDLPITEYEEHIAAVMEISRNEKRSME